MSISDPVWGLVEAAKFELYRRECDRSGILHCPACDGPVVEELDSLLPRDELVRGFVPGHRGCFLRPRPFRPKDHWKNEDRKHRRALEAQERFDKYLDWVESTIERHDKGDIAHCPFCDLPYDWETEGGQAMFEAGLVPGHPGCLVTPLLFDPQSSPQEFELEARKAS